MSARAIPPRDFALFFKKAPVAMVCIDLQRCEVVAVNERAGLWPGCLAGLPLADLLPPGEVARLRALFRSGAISADLEDSSVLLSEGGSCEVDMAFSRLPDSPLTLVAIHDRSARKRLEEELLAGGIAHDFNNLLTIIAGYSQMVQSGGAVQKADQKALTEVLKACEHAAELTGQLMAFSKRQGFRPVPVDLNRLVDDTRELLRRVVGQRIELLARPCDEPALVRADPGQMRQVILNLAMNARDAMPDGGTLSIRTAPDGSRIALEVSDTGAGMDAATRARIFEPFFTTKPFGQGTGLGLATVQRIVRQCGGTIEVSSTPGGGSSFRVLLPGLRGEDAAVSPGPSGAVRKQAC